ncbi:MAG: nuclear transport factor 2 family protein [Gaiellales bacterium]
MEADARTKAALIVLLESFCAAFASRDAEAATRLFAPDADIALVTSEESLLRGPEELGAFLWSYVQGPTTYSWKWDRVDVSATGDTAWLLAEGTETASAEGSEAAHPYRMSMICVRRGDGWLLKQVHGSSPHHG